MASTFSIRELSVRLGNLFQLRSEGEKEQDDIINTGDFHINLRTREVSLRGQTLALNREELEMLIFLTGHPRRVVTPRTLLSTRWGNHEVRQTDFLRVLTSLRKKIEAVDDSVHYIRTEPWIYYRFDPASCEASGRAG